MSQSRHFYPYFGCRKVCLEIWLFGIVLKREQQDQFLWKEPQFILASFEIRRGSMTLSWGRKRRIYKLQTIKSLTGDKSMLPAVA